MKYTPKLSKADTDYLDTLAEHIIDDIYDNVRVPNKISIDEEVYSIAKTKIEQLAISYLSSEIKAIMAIL